jgi:hypothetical protein
MSPSVFFHSFGLLAIIRIRIFTLELRANRIPSPSPDYHRRELQEKPINYRHLHQKYLQVHYILIIGFFGIVDKYKRLFGE